MTNMQRAIAIADKTIEKTWYKGKRKNTDMGGRIWQGMYMGALALLIEQDAEREALAEQNDRMMYGG